MIRNANNHKENDIKNSWYWSVLIKKYGDIDYATKVVEESRRRVDPMYKLYEREKL